jgi:hypothetical protein
MEMKDEIKVEKEIYYNLRIPEHQYEKMILVLKWVDGAGKLDGANLTEDTIKNNAKAANEILQWLS